MTSAISRYLHLDKSFPVRIGKMYKRVTHVLNIISVEAFATVRHVVPCAISWWIKEKVKKEFTSFSFPISTGKVQANAKLFLHGSLNIKKGEECTPILFVPGDYGPPFTLQHLAETAEEVHCGPIFHLHIPALHHDAHFNEQAIFIDWVISTIEKMIQEQGGVFKGILAAGHSKGAMLLVERQFCSAQFSKILRTFAVAGPLRNEGNCFGDSLRPIFENVNQKINEFTDRKFFQVIPEKDWASSYQAMAVRPSEYCFSVPGMHLSGLYSKETKNLFKQFLSNSP